MSDIIIKSAKLQFKNPQLGKPSRALEEHYYGRTIIAQVDGNERMFSFKLNELAFEVDEVDMIQAIESRLSEENAE